MKRYGMVSSLRPEKVEEYKKLHEAVWPDVLAAIKDSHIENYSIYLRVIDGQPFLFGYLEYSGEDFEADMAKLAAAPATQRWWVVCKPLQSPAANRGANEWWTYMEEVFHLD